MDPVPARVVLFFLRDDGSVGPFPGVVDSLLINSHSIASKGIVLLGLVLSETGLSVELGWFHVVEGRCKVDIDICFDDADGVILVLGPDLKYIDVELLAEDFDGNGVLLVEAGEVPQLVFQHCLGVVQIDEFGLMGLQLDHVPDVPVLLLHVSHQGQSGGTPWFGELEHLEHPGRNIAQSLLGHELQHSAVGHLGTVL